VSGVGLLRKPARAGLILAASTALISAAPSAEAAGMYFSDRGVRPMGRAGAWVAGADDLGAIWYNPAGVAEAGSAVLVDFAWLRFEPEYTRKLRIVDADNTVRYVDSPKVSGSPPLIPLPTMAISTTVDDAKRWTIAGGVLAPYIALAGYQDVIAGQPSPARYTLGSFNGSALALPGAWVAYKASDQLRFGLGVMALVGWFQSTITFSACPQDRLICAPEQPEYDAQSQLRVGPMFAPTATGGVIWQPIPSVRVGASGMLPMIISSDATIKVRLGTSPAFDDAQVVGDQAHVRFVLPGIARLGVEVRPVSELRLEAAWVHEFWSGHSSIKATPKNISITGITGGPPSVAMPVIDIPRGFVDSNSLRLGMQYDFKAGGYRLEQRAGISFESSAVPKGYLSLSSLDFAKINVMLGGSLYVGARWRFDAVYGHTFASTTFVEPAEAKIPRINPLAGNAPLEAVNGGTYSAHADLIGAGMNYAF
jgi:long-chain fatty acid transport protein